MDTHPYHIVDRSMLRNSVCMCCMLAFIAAEGVHGLTFPLLAASDLWSWGVKPTSPTEVKIYAA